MSASLSLPRRPLLRGRPRKLGTRLSAAVFYSRETICFPSNLGAAQPSASRIDEARPGRRCRSIPCPRRRADPDLSTFLRRRIPDSGELEDVCQEILLTLYQARHTYQPLRPLEPWFFAIARKCRCRSLSPVLDASPVAGAHGGAPRRGSGKPGARQGHLRQASLSFRACSARRLSCSK